MQKVAPIPGFSETERTLSSNFMPYTVLSFKGWCSDQLLGNSLNVSSRVALGNVCFFDSVITFVNAAYKLLPKPLPPIGELANGYLHRGLPLINRGICYMLLRPFHL